MQSAVGGHPERSAFAQRFCVVKDQLFLNAIYRKQTLDSTPDF
jgi:hypothetical protein